MLAQPKKTWMLFLEILKRYKNIHDKDVPFNYNGADTVN